MLKFSFFLKGNLIKILESKRKYKHLKIILALGSYDTKAFGFEEITNPNNTEVIKIKERHITSSF